MSWLLSSQLRRIVAGLLLLLDLGLEPGSALAFADLEDESAEAVADLCRLTDIWGGCDGLSPGADAIALAVGPEPGLATRDKTRTHAAVTAGNVGPGGDCLTSFPANPDAIAALPDILQTRIPRRPGLAFGEHVLHRNSWLAQKRVLILIV